MTKQPHSLNIVENRTSHYMFAEHLTPSIVSRCLSCIRSIAVVTKGSTSRKSRFHFSYFIKKRFESRDNVQHDLDIQSKRRNHCLELYKRLRKALDTTRITSIRALLFSLPLHNIPHAQLLSPYVEEMG